MELGSIAPFVTLSVIHFWYVQAGRRPCTLTGAAFLARLVMYYFITSCTCKVLRISVNGILYLVWEGCISRARQVFVLATVLDLRPIVATIASPGHMRFLRVCTYERRGVNAVYYCLYRSPGSYRTVRQNIFRESYISCPRRV